jgi:hypothetical protein
LGISEIGKNPSRHFGDYMVALAHDRYFCRFPVRVLGRGHSHWAMVGPSVSLGKDISSPACAVPGRLPAQLIGKNTPASVTAK